MSRPAVLWVGALLLGALVVVFFPESNAPQVSPRTSSFPAKEVAEVAVTSVLAPAAVQPDVKGATATADMAKPADVSKAASEPVPAVVSPAPAAAAVIAASPASVPVVKGSPALISSTLSSAAPGQAGGLVSFKAKGETWVEVTDAKGVTQVRKILAAGEVASASGALPLSVVVGRADMTVVEVRGQAFSLDAITKENVARFEVK